MESVGGEDWALKENWALKGEANVAFLVRQMRRALIAVISTTLLFGPCAAAEERFPGVEWEHLPQAQDGWSEAGLAAAQELSRLIGSSTVMVIHYGAIVTEWGDPAKRTELYSVRKNLLSALIDIAVAQGKMSVESTLAQLAIEDNSPSPTDLEKQATVRMLLKARSGVYHAALYETPEMAAQRPARGRWCRRTGCAKARAPIPRPGAVEAMAICGGLPATRKARFRKEVSLR